MQTTWIHSPSFHYQFKETVMHTHNYVLKTDTHILLIHRHRIPKHTLLWTHTRTQTNLLTNTWK